MLPSIRITISATSSCSSPAFGLATPAFGLTTPACVMRESNTSTASSSSDTSSPSCPQALSLLSTKVQILAQHLLRPPTPPLLPALLAAASAT